MGLENLLKSYLGLDNKSILKLLKENLSKIETPLLMEILKILNEELKNRIKQFEDTK